MLFSNVPLLSECNDASEGHFNVFNRHFGFKFNWNFFL